MKDYKNVILFSDMDGTLLNSNSIVSEENRQAVNAFVAGGGLFGIATGRSQLNSPMFLEDMKINTPCIVYNGGGIYDFEAKKFLVLSELSKSKLMDFLQKCLVEFKDVVLLIYTQDECYVISPQTLANKDFVAAHQPCLFGDFVDVIDKPWIKILFSGKTVDLKAVEAVMKSDNLENEINWVYSGDTYLEFLPKQVTKGSALTKVREYMGGDYKIYAVGDYNNDLEMLAAADVGIATSNALPAVKLIADRITVSNDENAIADVIYNIIR
jgi:Cof subfamily protein (haloacid dehalogenase superfamily)